MCKQAKFVGSNSNVFFLSLFAQFQGRKFIPLFFSITLIIFKTTEKHLS